MGALDDSLRMFMSGLFRTVRKTQQLQLGWKPRYHQRCISSENLLQLSNGAGCGLVHSAPRACYERWFLVPLQITLLHMNSLGPKQGNILAIAFLSSKMLLSTRSPHSSIF